MKKKSVITMCDSTSTSHFHKQKKNRREAPESNENHSKSKKQERKCDSTSKRGDRNKRKEKRKRDASRDSYEEPEQTRVQDADADRHRTGRKHKDRKHQRHKREERESQEMENIRSQISSPVRKTAIDDNFEGTDKKYRESTIPFKSDAKSSPKSSGLSEENEYQDYNFDFAKYKHSLNRIFFRDKDMIQRGSKEYEDFWAFLEKYLQYQKKKHQESVAGSAKVSHAIPGTLNIPNKYDCLYRINLSLISRDVEDFIKKGRLVDYDVDQELTREHVRQFHGILQHYLDFTQKQKFQKLKKIKRDQKNLPIYQYCEQIIATIHQHQVVVVAGDTGCGKSTQVPQYLLEAGFTKIACTQPRRIACISLAKRVSYETLNEYGSQVAFQVRFEKSKTSATRILFLTEGLLLRQMSTDSLLSQYSVIVIDEVHERHIHTDFLLGVLKCLLKLRSDLKLVLMSATINISLFSAYFDGAPVIKVPGRLYPIEMEYCPFNKANEMYARPERLDPTPYIRIMQRIDSKYSASERGDMLIFLSGMTEIMTVVEAARMYSQQVKRWIVLPLHSALSVEEQEKVFDYPPEGVRKCIVSTNIAETSVTIDGVRFVVDSGKVKEMSFDPKYKMQRLKEFWISRASAEQRKGRAGRTGPGVCFRLYAESDYDAFQAYTTPEIQRVPLDSLILQLVSMGLTNVRKFPFIEPPDISSIENSISYLKEQGALASDESLTPIGQMLAMLPVDVVFGKMLIMGSIFHMTDPVLSVAAALSVQSPFTSKAHVDHDGIAARRALESDHGDPLTLLNAFDEWIQVKAEGRGTRKWCRRRCLEEQRFYEMTKLKKQFQQLLQDHHLLDRGGDQRQFLTSEERRLQHGERKRLNQLQRQLQQKRKKRRVLRMEDEEYAVSDQEEDDRGSDIRDLEFRLSHNLNQLQETANHSRSFTLQDINLLKIILSSGIYPQIAIADDCNSFKGDSDQAFHTKSKPFVLLHPTSIFANHSNLLKPAEVPEKHAGHIDLKGHLSTKHELLAYGSLLETNGKPYLVNCMRVPALQTVTLFATAIDTNTDCTRLVCDEWLEIHLPDAESADQVISSIVSLRATWQSLLQLRLEDTFQSLDEDRNISPRARQLEQLLARKLAEFLDSCIPYTLRRILTAEVQHMYIGPGNNNKATGKLNILKKDLHLKKEHPIKGGVQVNSYLTLNCLLDEASASVWEEYTAHMQRHWKCPQCGENMVVSVTERLHHESTCQHHMSAPSFAGSSEEKEDKQMASNPFRKLFFCAECQTQLSLTATEILRHKKSHAVENGSVFDTKAALS